MFGPKNLVLRNFGLKMLNLQKIESYDLFDHKEKEKKVMQSVQIVISCRVIASSCPLKPGRSK